MRQLWSMLAGAVRKSPAAHSPGHLPDAHVPGSAVSAHHSALPGRDVVPGEGTASRAGWDTWPADATDHGAPPLAEDAVAPGTSAWDTWGDHAGEVGKLGLDAAEQVGSAGANQDFEDPSPDPPPGLSAAEIYDRFDDWHA